MTPRSRRYFDKQKIIVRHAGLIGHIPTSSRFATMAVMSLDPTVGKSYTGGLMAVPLARLNKPTLQCILADGTIHDYGACGVESQVTDINTYYDNTIFDYIGIGRIYSTGGRVVLSESHTVHHFWKYKS